MRLSCKIDGKKRSFSVNSDKPLLQILIDDLEIGSMLSICQGAYCGNCVVLVDGKAVLSCLVPAFRLQDADIETFESFRKTRAFRDINRSYKAVGCVPCDRCFASKTLIIESVIQTLEKQAAPRTEGVALRRSAEIEEMRRSREEMIARELALNSCSCVRPGELVRVVEECLAFRRKRNVRRA